VGNECCIEKPKAENGAYRRQTRMLTQIGRNQPYISESSACYVFDSDVDVPSWELKSVCNDGKYLFPFLRIECRRGETVLDSVAIIEALKAPVLFFSNGHLRDQTIDPSI